MSPKSPRKSTANAASGAKPEKAANAEKRVAFRLHPRVLWDIITRQSGTLDRAVLEGVQNSIDAGATEVALTCDGTTLTITDNGAGFTSEAEIERCFATFGAPQTADEKAKKRFGYYRLGRGQLFAHGRNQWASAAFRMDVDIRAQASDGHCDEIDFGLSTDADPAAAAAGCAITIQLYKPLLPSDLAALYRDVKQQVRYIEAVAITWNGERVSLDPSKGKWDLVTEEAYVRLTDSSTLALYNLGVLVKHFPDSRFGTGGVVVSRKQLKVNFARNDVMSDCPVWPRVMRAIDQRAKRRRKAVLTDAERKQIARQIGERSYDGVESVRKLKLVTDVKGDVWSVEQIERWMEKHAVTKLAVCRDRFDHRGDRLMQYRLAFVVGQATLDAFGAETLDEWIAILAAYNAVTTLPHAEPCTLDEAAALLRTDYRIVPEADYTPTERAAVRLLNQARYTVMWPIHDRTVTLYLGQSDMADGWTDGRSYIVLHRKLVQSLGSVETFHALGHVLLHEVSHIVDGDGSQGEHVHNSTFYQTYHDGHQRLAHFVDACLTHWPKALESEGLAMRKAALREQDRAAKLARARAAFDAAVAATANTEADAVAEKKEEQKEQEGQRASGAPQTSAKEGTKGTKVTPGQRRRPIDAAPSPYYALLL